MEQTNTSIQASAARNVLSIRQQFIHNDFLVVRDISQDAGAGHAVLVYLNVLIDEKALNQVIIRKISEDLTQRNNASAGAILDSLYTVSNVTTLPELKAAADFITDAGVILFVEGHTSAYGIKLPGFETRNIGEPKIEVNVRGPRESFIEDLHTNLSLIFRKLKTPHLKTITYIIGTQSQTKVTLLYLDNKADPNLLNELKRRLETIQLDILVVNTQIEEWIQDSTWSPIPQLFNTERPDRVVTALNRGKAALIADGTPIALIVPSTFFEMLHPSEDLYERFYFANFLRVLRLITLFISLFGPSLYIALTTFHLEMIPTPLMMAFISSKAGIPFPTFVEAILMEVSFEILREASLRLPRAVGQSVSIVGALVIGEAAVQSGIVSRPMVIVVAMTGIASFTIPAFSTAISFRILRFPLMLLAAYVGVLGISLGMLVLVLHLCSLRSCGVPFLNPVSPSGLKTTLQNYIQLPVKYRPRNKGGS
ncbi:spore germination protein [Paenibacillus sp. R14(2021)]|uniref:spore germination protein n=1 Tax=Paenibacillus sp. R14(2021) TaxID=2859228 RepID=UPI001C61404A|nr:spore germination protein [Paenibacillus sp. R14(2021)]